ncbi:sirohydrochlorin chelatase [Alteribacillus iranensis]|uniref:Sirohydrochlorin cobaltochelatase n=1 Tax=Alteribacillus iranensis TaxID=930128 RepID=A0A1I2B5P3_9BACI|nr:sirohydrochlorin chelatase [Alteribacillus iranensis]SFE51522.1 sirohydrochlorin cobaltochelatase [Alteribacillus iranensis]
MKAVLFVGHGSPLDKGNEETIQFINNIKNKINVPIIETCFLEFAAPNIASGIEICVEKGATSVALVPIMFLPAGHSKIHIPHAIDEAKEKYPLVHFTYGRPIGIHEEVVRILEERVTAVWEQEEEHTDTALLILGRGSSDPDTNSEVYKLSRLVSERLNQQTTEVSFIGVTTPTVEEGVERCLRLGMRKIILVPCLFFSGVLMDRVEEKMDAFRKNYPDNEFASTDPVGFHPRLERVLLERTEEALAGSASLNCDLCQYRQFAMEHMDGLDHHHHHEHSHG